jgi:hypothetical protein
MRVLAVDDDDACDSAVAGQKMPSMSVGKSLRASAGAGG